MTSSDTRLVVVGCNSTVWKRLKGQVPLPILELSHSQIADAPISSRDVVWVFAYSRRDEDNRSMLAQLATAGARQVVYVSTATAMIGERHRCYSYPRSKLRAEAAAREILGAQIVRLGLVYKHEDELPGGTSLTTALSSIAEAIELSLRSGPQAVARDLFEPVTRSFGSKAEKAGYRLYGALLRIVPTPCLLRPLDLALGAVGWRWYGYLYLSNRQWLSTT